MTMPVTSDQGQVHQAGRMNGMMPNAIGATSPAAVPFAQPGSEKLENFSFDALLMGLIQTAEIGEIVTASSDSANPDPRSTSQPPLNWKPESENLLPDLDPRLLQGFSVPTLKQEQPIITDTPKLMTETPLLALQVPSLEVELAAVKPPSPEAEPTDFQQFEVHKLEFTIERLPVDEAAPKAPLKPRESDHFVMTPFEMKPYLQFAQRLIPVEQVYSVNIPDLPPPPPVARKVSMEVGDGDTQVKITIHERNGDLSVRFDSASELMRRDLETRAGSLVEALQREQIQVSNFEFRDSFGSATESDKAPNRYPRLKKGLKLGAVFADEDETTQLLHTSDTNKTNKISD
jgi:hypothetical protein